MCDETQEWRSYYRLSSELALLSELGLLSELPILSELTLETLSSLLVLACASAILH